MTPLLRTTSLWLLFTATSALALDLAPAYTAIRLGDFELAASQFEQAAREGSTEAQYQLGRLYLSGRGVKQNEAQAMRWLQKAAAAGDASAVAALDKLSAPPTSEPVLIDSQLLPAAWRPAADGSVIAQYLQSGTGESSADQWSQALEAIIHERARLLHALLEEQDSHLARSSDKRGRTLLMYASEISNGEILALLAARSQLDQADSEGRTALDYAARECNTETADRLLALGADREARTRQDNTP